MPRAKPERKLTWEHRANSTGSGWTCPQCTFVNVAVSRACSICGAEGLPAQKPPDNQRPSTEERAADCSLLAVEPEIVSGAFYADDREMKQLMAEQCHHPVTVYFSHQYQRLELLAATMPASATSYGEQHDMDVSKAELTRADPEGCWRLDLELPDWCATSRSNHLINFKCTSLDVSQKKSVPLVFSLTVSSGGAPNVGFVSPGGSTNSFSYPQFLRAMVVDNPRQILRPLLGIAGTLAHTLVATLHVSNTDPDPSDAAVRMIECIASAVKYAPNLPTLAAVAGQAVAPSIRCLCVTSVRCLCVMCTILVCEMFTLLVCDICALAVWVMCTMLVCKMCALPVCEMCAQALELMPLPDGYLTPVALFHLVRGSDLLPQLDKFPAGATWSDSNRGRAK